MYSKGLAQVFVVLNVTLANSGLIPFSVVSSFSETQPLFKERSNTSKKMQT